MADLSDVEDALLGTLIGLTYPNGTAAASIIGAGVRLYRGWPITISLTADIAAGMANVSVFPVPGSTHNTTRWGLVATATPAANTLAVSVSGNVATFSGTAAPGQLAGILADNMAYIYTVQIGDTPASIAANLGVLISESRPCQISGATVTVPGAIQYVARTTMPANAIEEWGRQEQGFRISVWAPSPQSRDILCKAFGAGLAPLTFLTLADGTAGRLRYRSTDSLDDGRDASIYRRDLIYDVEYATTTTTTVPTMLFGDLVWNGAPILN